VPLVVVRAPICFDGFLLESTFALQLVRGMHWRDMISVGIQLHGKLSLFHVMDGWVGFSYTSMIYTQLTSKFFYLWTVPFLSPLSISFAGFLVPFFIHSFVFPYVYF
jgi:hypothetical protein